MYWRASSICGLSEITTDRHQHGKQQRPCGKKTMTRAWPNTLLGLIRGAAAISFENDHSKDSERLRILISMTIWAIWKSRNKNSGRRVLRGKRDFKGTNTRDDQEKLERNAHFESSGLKVTLHILTPRKTRRSIFPNGMWPGDTGVGGCLWVGLSGIFVQRAIGPPTGKPRGSPTHDAMGRQVHDTFPSLPLNPPTQ